MGGNKNTPVPIFIPQEASLPLTPRTELRLPLKYILSGIAIMAGIVASVTLSYAELDKRVDSNRIELGRKAEQSMFQGLATKEDLSRLREGIREDFLAAKWECDRTREGMICRPRLRRHGRDE